MNRELLRYVDTIHRDRQIDKEVIFKGIELALLSAAQKKLGEIDGIDVKIDRESGAIAATVEGEPLSPEEFGRIAALSGKQVLYQKIREAEREVLFDEYEPRLNHLMTGTVQSKKPNGVMLVSLGNKAEGFLPRSEQSIVENFNEGDRIKVVLKEVNMQPNRVQLLCSRASGELVKRLFEIEIPEVADHVVEIKAIAREAGHRTKIAVSTYDQNVDCVGACVGVKGARIRNIVDELFGEKIDIVRWNESIEVFIVEALRPAEIASLDLDFDTRSVTVYVKPDQQSLAIGRKGQNVRLASKLTEWDLNIAPVTDEDLERMKAEGLENLATGIFQDRFAQHEEAAANRESELAESNKLDALFKPATAAEDSAEDATSEDDSVETPEGATTEEPEVSAEPTAEESSATDAAWKNAFGDAFAEDRGPSSLEVPIEAIPGIDDDLAAELRDRGCDTGGSLVELGEDGLAGIEGVDADRAKRIMQYLQSL